MQFFIDGIRGDDANPGTPEEPMKTLYHAIVAGADDVYIIGNYPPHFGFAASPTIKWSETPQNL